MLRRKGMGEADLKGNMFEAPGFVKDDPKHGEHQSMNMDDHDAVIKISDSSSIGDCSITSSSSSSSDLVDDASSPSSISNSSSSTICNGPSFELSELMAQLPIKRGLSKYYKGKSESFRSLSSVKTIEELAKKETPFYRKKTKARKSYGGRLHAYKLYTLPRPTTSKKSPHK